MEQEIKRLKELLPTLNPISKDYTRVLKNLMMLADYTQYHENSTYQFEPKHQDEPKVIIEPTPMAESIPAPVVEQPKPVEITDPTKMTKEEVRALLSSASKNGVQIQPIIEKYVPEGKPVKFSEVPASSYPELVKEITNAG